MKSVTPETLANLRIMILEMIAKAKSGHPGGSLSCIDILSILWFEQMRGPWDRHERDRFVLSKGHGVPALYAVLAELGQIDKKLLPTLRQTGSPLQGHPDRVRIPLLEASTGSLGQGLSVAQGLALGLTGPHKSSEVYCLVGDGELQEGQIWEAALSAPKFRLQNLCLIIDANNGQIDGPVSEVMPSLEPLEEKWKSFGWQTSTIDGHSLTEIRATFHSFRQKQGTADRRPTAVIARTIKGKGVSFMENKIEWHGVAPKPEELARAVVELRK